ncbi:MAG: polysulfide reductase NrfD [Thermoflexales bacterium]|nr:polysulfide reductase NrfD [Thermoflexales bacterium]
MSPIEVELTGANGDIFPTLTTWGWEIALYLFLGGLVAGLMMLSSVVRLTRSERFPTLLKVADLAGAPLLALGLFMLLFDLTQLGHVWRLYVTFQISSPMSWGAWILLIAMGVLALWFVARLPAQAPRLGKRTLPAGPWRLISRLGGWVRAHARGLAVVTLLLGVGVGFYTGLLLSTIPARPAWNSAALAPLFLISGLATGGAFACLFIPHDEHLRLVPVSIAACLIEFALLAVFVLTLADGNAAAQRAGVILTTGTIGVALLLGTLTLGLLVPATVETFDALRRPLRFIPARLPPLLKLAGGVVLRLAIVYAGIQSFV